MPRLILSMKPFYPLFFYPLSLSLLFLRERSVDFFFSIGWCKKRKGPIIFERVDLKDFKIIIRDILGDFVVFKDRRREEKEKLEENGMPNKLGKED